MKNFILADEPFAKGLQISETCASVNNSLFENLVSLLEVAIKFDERFHVTSLPFFIPGFNSISCELENFKIKGFYLVILF